MPRVFLAKIKSGPSPGFYTWTIVAVLLMEIDRWLAGLWLLSHVKMKNIRHRSFSCPRTSDNKCALPNFSHSALMTVITEETVTVLALFPYFTDKQTKAQRR